MSQDGYDHVVYCLTLSSREKLIFHFANVVVLRKKFGFLWLFIICNQWLSSAYLAACFIQKHIQVNLSNINFISELRLTFIARC